MTHTVIYNQDLKVIETKVQGNISLKNLKELIAEIAQISEETGCVLILNDNREATIQLSTVDIYGLPRIMEETFISLGIDPSRLMRAHVIARDAKDTHFYETVSANIFQTVRFFYDIDEAKKWLFSRK
jgi:hypothetical protein